MNEKPILYAINERQAKYMREAYPGMEVVLIPKLPAPPKHTDARANTGYVVSKHKKGKK